MKAEVEALDSADIEAFVALMRESLSAEQLDLTIYACKGIGNYIAYELQIPAALSKKHYFVMKDGAELIAGIVLRRIDEGINLDYIVTKDTARSRGLARKLWQEAVARLPHSAEFMRLDVFNSNELALSWYRKSGFTETTRTCLWSCQPLHKHPAPASLSNYPQAEVVQEKFGFSQLSLVVDKHEFTVGRMGNKWFRINNEAVLNNPAVLACLSQLEPRRRILAVVPPDFQFSPALFGDLVLKDELLSMRVAFDDWLLRKAES